MDSNEVRKIAALAYVSFSDEELVRIQKDLTNILDLVQILQHEDTEGIMPRAHPLETTQGLRSDEVTEVDERKALQRFAPAVSDGYYLVPKVIE